MTLGGILERLGAVAFRYRVSPQRGFEYLSPAIAALTGYALREFDSNPDLLLQIVHPEDREALRNLLAGNMGGQNNPVLRWTHRAGHALRVEHRISPACGPRGQIVAVEGFFLDVTSRQAQEQTPGSSMQGHEAEEKYKQIAEDLKRSNQELGRFAYIASHDLQEPVRSIIAYLQILQRRYKGKIDSDADEFIGFAVEGAFRMRSLIEALLAYSQVGSHCVCLKPIDLRVALDHAMEALASVIQTSGAHISISGSLPIVVCDAMQMAQLFQNLIGNAIKFRGENRPEIAISARDEGSEWLVTVQDNGIGIPQKYGERVFIVFQRLHGHDKYGGVGIGLAICRKIIERHGGRIWVESEPGQGAAFRFTLPKQRPR
jgi:PAS domain S-box-containing protein